jgi:hypothetical protein
MTQMRPSRMRVGAVVVLGALFLGILAPGIAAAASRPITFTVFDGDWCLTGHASDGSTVSYRIRDAAGNLKDQGSVQASDNTGYFFSDCADSYPGWGLGPGDRITASDGHSTRKFVVPDLRIYVNRLTDTVRGTAPAGTSLLLEYLWPAYPGWEIIGHEKTLTVDDEGLWLFRLPKGWDVDGGDGVSIEWSSPQGDSVFTGADAPYVTVTLGRSDFSGEAPEYSTASTKLMDPVTHAVLASATATVGVNQGFTATFRDVDGKRRAVAPGDYLISTVASDAAFMVPDIEVSGDAATDTVTGRCYDTGRATQSMHIAVYRTGIRRGYVYAGTETDGTFTYHFDKYDFPQPAVLKHGDKLLVRCFQVNGDVVQKWATVP